MKEMSCVTGPCFIQEKAKVWCPGLSSHQYKRKQLTAMLRVEGVSCSMHLNKWLSLCCMIVPGPQQIFECQITKRLLLPKLEQCTP